MKARTLSRDIVKAAQALTYAELPREVVDKVKIALIDMLSCVFESLDLAPSQQAIELASRARGQATVIGTAVDSSISEAAFANAILSHGLVREDMHTGSVSHLGVVVFPALLALAQHKKSLGRDFILSAVCGYEVSAAIGRALMDKDNVRRYRPTGICGPPGAAVAGSLLIGLSEDATVSALGLAANTTVGLNEWPAKGADEMFFHVGFAARNAVIAVELAELGMYSSETALDGPAGLFAALARLDRVSSVAPFANGTFEILSVYHKPAPACNYAQTACQVARLLAVEDKISTADIATIKVRATASAINYPGCNATGPFERVLQAKMSIQYCVAATLIRGAIEEANYRMLEDSEIARLIALTTLEEGSEFTAAYPRIQGTEVIVTLKDGREVRRVLTDVIPATPDEIRARFRKAAEQVLGAEATSEIEIMIDRLENQEDVAVLTALLSLNTRRVTAA